MISQTDLKVLLYEVPNLDNSLTVSSQPPILDINFLFQSALMVCQGVSHFVKRDITFSLAFNVPQASLKSPGIFLNLIVGAITASRGSSVLVKNFQPLF